MECGNTICVAINISEPLAFVNHLLCLVMMICPDTAYLIVHEWYHIGEICMVLKQAGYPLDDKVAYGL